MLRKSVPFAVLAVAGVPRQSFSSLGFSTMSQIKIGPDGGEQKISIETANHSLNYVIEAKLSAVQ